MVSKATNHKVSMRKNLTSSLHFSIGGNASECLSCLPNFDLSSRGAPGVPQGAPSGPPRGMFENIRFLCGMISKNMSKWNSWNASNKCFDSSYMVCFQKQILTISTKTKFNRKTNLEINQINKAASEFSLAQCLRISYLFLQGSIIDHS